MLTEAAALLHRGGFNMSDGVRLRGRAGLGRAGLGRVGRPVRSNSALQSKQSESEASVVSGFKPEMRAGLLASVY